MEDKTVMDYIGTLCAGAGEDEAFAAAFFEKLKDDEEIYEEFCYYMVHENFACTVKVEGISVVDVLIWQMDHFKARLDRDNTGTRENRERMVLLAFDTLLNMKKNPDKYIVRMSEETGTDYEGKY
ncbi:MAG: hypothetical protein K2O16_15800 [Lachnospiraceae bacterium]|nr:hypothetical protein [Lachnospiraceae bacterium]MDE7333650.1 hypothetical protein [Lachnospiraceae bacterium]